MAMSLDETAREIYAGIKRGEHFPQRFKGAFGLDDAYRVQLAIGALRATDGDPQVGWKIGLTAKAIQEMEGFSEPIFALLFHSGMLDSGAELTYDELRSPAFENELCIRLRSALQGPGVTADAARAAIDTVAPAFEIVERRGVLSDAPELAIADNLGQKAFVTGAPVAPAAGLRLADTTCEVRVNDQPRGTGAGSAVLDDPANSVAWLANKLADFGLRIEAGQPIMSGSFTLPFPLEQGDRAHTDFTPFGPVAASVK